MVANRKLHSRRIPKQCIIEEWNLIKFTVSLGASSQACDKSAEESPPAVGERWSALVLAVLPPNEPSSLVMSPQLSIFQ